MPTFVELGYMDLTEGVWIGLWTTPDELMAGLRTASDRQGAMLQAIGFKPD